jgi:DUF1365 family protein
MKSEFYISFVRHIRYFPKRYEFDYRFFWTKFDLDELDELDKSSTFFSRNRFNLITFRDDDHINLGLKTTKENVIAFLREEGVNEDIVSIELVTNPRVMGYTFNPVSFYFIETNCSPYLVIEIGNTFNEKKPYLVKSEAKINGEWIFSSVKHFYISPFTSVENSMTFRIRKNEKSLVINIDDFNKEGVLEVQALYTGSSRPWTNETILKLLFQYPLITFRIIASIHYHALKLFLKKIPFWKKSDEAHLQKDVFVWEKKSYRRKPKAS